MHNLSVAHHLGQLFRAEEALKHYVFAAQAESHIYYCSIGDIILVVIDDCCELSIFCIGRFHESLQIEKLTHCLEVRPGDLNYVWGDKFVLQIYGGAFTFIFFLGSRKNFRDSVLGLDRKNADFKMCESRIRFDFCCKFIVTLKVTISKRIFDIDHQRMFLTYFQIVISKLFLVMLVLSALHLVFIGILRVLIEVGLSLTVDSDFKDLSMLVVSSTGDYSIFDGFK